MNLETLATDTPATLIHSHTGKEVEDCVLPAGTKFQREPAVDKLAPSILVDGYRYALEGEPSVLTSLWEIGHRVIHGKAIPCTIMEGALGNGRTEKSLRVTRVLNGCVACEQGSTSDPQFVPEAMARTILVSKDT